MDFVFFSHAINHVAWQDGCWPSPGVRSWWVWQVLVDSLSRMASFMADMKCRQIEITRGYGRQRHDNLKEILMNAGAKNSPTVFLFLTRK